MKISIVTSLYNEEKNIPKYFKAINSIDYPKEKFEVILVNDGSTDKTLELLNKEKQNSKFNVRIINLEKNLGISTAVDTGVRAATYQHVLLLITKAEIFPNALKEFEKLNHSAIVGTAIQKNNHIFDKFFLSVKNKIHKNNFSPGKTEIFLTKENFNNTRKGTTIFFCEKNLYIESQIKNKESKHSSDDTKLLWNIVQKTPIIVSSKPKCYYNTRSTLKDNIIHLLNRGPKFVDYYYKPNNIMFYLINLGIILFIICLYLIITQNKLQEVTAILITANLFISIFISSKLSELTINFVLFPFFITIFFIGIIRGLIIKILPRKNV